jgi:hypothetical protein
MPSKLIGPTLTHTYSSEGELILFVAGISNDPND